MPASPIQPALSDISVCVFDAYGTLFDVASAAHRLEGRLNGKAADLAALWRTKQLEYTWLRSLMGVHADFWHVTGDGLDHALDALGLADPMLREDLMALYRRLDAYTEVPEVLNQVRTAGLKTAILSNGAPGMLSDAVSSAGIGNLLDACLSVEQVGIFKPHPDTYRLATKRFDVAPGQICFMSSNAWDVAGAAQFGFQVVWINRFGAVPERLPMGPKVVLDSLHGLTDLLGC